MGDEFIIYIDDFGHQLAQTGRFLIFLAPSTAFEVLLPVPMAVT
jgi:hypothetical protein